MTDTEMNPAASLAGYLCRTTPEQAVKAAMELCEQLPGDPEGFHGGVWPGNVTLDGDGKAVLGMPMSTPAAQRPANQVEYLAPEFFWDGATSAAADVFSVGLMIYAGCSKGFLPFQPHKDDLSNQERADALRKRMKGAVIPAPEGVSEDLAKVLEKALAYKPEDRYITAKEMLFALHWTDEALGPDKDRDAAAAAAVPEAESADASLEFPTKEAPVIPEAPPEPEETTEEMLREADAVLAAAAATAAVAAGGAAVAAGKAGEDASGAGAEGGETPADDANASDTEGGGPDDSEAASEEGSPAQTGDGQDFVKEAPEDRAADKVAAAAAAAIGAAGAAAAGAAAKKEYKVRKDFENSPDKKAPTVAPAKKKKSKAVPILCGVAAAVLLGSVGYMVYGNRTPGHSEPSPLFTPDGAEEVTLEASPSPMVITPEPTGTAKPTDEPEASPDGTAEPGATPGDDGVIIVTPAPGTIGGTAAAGALTGEAGGDTQSGGNTGTAPGGAGTGGSAGTTPGSTTGTGSGSGTSAGTGSGSPAGPSGTGTGSGGTSWGGNTGSGGGTSWGGNTGSGGGTSWGGGTGSGGGSATTPAPSYTVTPADDTVYITGMGVNVRSGPGTSYPIIGSANTGYELKRTGTSGDWSRVAFKGTTGFVSNTYLSTTNPTPSATAQPQQTAAPAPRYTVTGGDLTYADAKTQAQSQGGLTVIGSDDDFEAVTRELNNGGGVEYAWLGVEYDSAFDCWRWSDGTVLYTGDSHWAAGSPKAGDDLVLLAKQDGSWKYVSLSSSTFDPTDGAYAGKLGYVTGS